VPGWLWGELTFIELDNCLGNGLTLCMGLRAEAGDVGITTELEMAAGVVWNAGSDATAITADSGTSLVQEHSVKLRLPPDVRRRVASSSRGWLPPLSSIWRTTVVAGVAVGEDAMSADAWRMPHCNEEEEYNVPSILASMKGDLQVALAGKDRLEGRLGVAPACIASIFSSMRNWSTAW